MDKRIYLSRSAFVQHIAFEVDTDGIAGGRELMNKQQFMKAFGYRTVSLTNLLTNGNFASTANWSAYDSSFSVSSNVAYTTATAIGGSIAQYNISVTNGYKCYCCAHILCQSTNEIFWINSQESDRIYLLPSGTGSFEYVSGIYTPNQTANAAFVAVLTAGLADGQRSK